MTGNWQPPPPWHVSFEDEVALVVRRPEGTVVARIEPYAVTPELRGGGLLRTWRAYSAVGPDAALWLNARGRLRQGAEPISFATADGTPVELWNGRSKGWRRIHRNGRIVIGTRHYAVRHRSRRRTRLVADGARRATLRRKGFGWGLHADDPPRHVVRLETAPDPLDELAVVLAGSVLGPAGRPGFWANSSGGFGP